MTFLQLILMLLDLLRAITAAANVEALKSDPRAQEFGDGTFLTWLWENREQIVEFLLMLLEKLTGQPRTTIMQAVQEDNVTAVQTLDVK